MSFPHSVTEHWLPEFKSGNPDAADALLKRFFSRIVRLARDRLAQRNVPKRVADEEDVAQSVCRRLCSMASGQKLDAVECTDDLWTLLVTITGGKVVDMIRRETAQKRGGGEVQGESLFTPESSIAGIERVAGGEVPPDIQFEFNDLFCWLMNALPDDHPRSILSRRLHGDNIKEIADDLGVTRQAVNRTLDVVRSIWKKAEADGS